MYEDVSGLRFVVDGSAMDERARICVCGGAGRAGQRVISKARCDGSCVLGECWYL